jgi:diguanylate cyclase (GGDEF)-like protein
MDLHTLHVEHAVLLSLYSILTFVNSRLHLTSQGVHWFPLYNICAFVGAVLIALRGDIWAPLSIVGGTLSFPIAYLFLHRSLTDFFGKGAFQWRLQAFLVVIGAVGLTYYGAIHPNTRNRLILYSFVLAGQMGLSAYFVLRNAKGYLTTSATLMGLVLVVLFLTNLIRGIGTIFRGAPDNYLNGGPLLTWSLVIISVLQGGVTVAFVWMTAATLREDLLRQASTDPLTGVLNRRAAEHAAEREIALSQASQRPFSVILVDLDRFKQLNDQLGHQFGDAALVAVSKCFQEELRKGDILARIGGDEFVVLLADTSLDMAIDIAERLRISLEEMTVVHDGHTRTVSASFGLAQLEHTLDWDRLVMNCDKALYSVKANGGNLVASA